MQTRPQPQPHDPSAAGQAPGAPHARFTARGGQPVSEITAPERLTPFLMSLVSDTDLWMFVTSTGGLTAGRRDADGALFPYVTVDQLHHAHHHTGPATAIRVARAGEEPRLWEPLAGTAALPPGRARRLAKTLLGHQATWQEDAADLGLCLTARWAACDAFGWVRTVTVENRGETPVRLELVDGLRNLLPPGAPLSLYQQSSTLVDAYKTSEVDPDTGLGIISLSAGITDRAEALESLRATTAFGCGLPGARVHLDARVLDDLRTGRVLRTAPRLDGQRASYLLSAELELAPGEQAQWHLAADTGQDHAEVVARRQWLAAAPDPAGAIEDALGQATADLRGILASADGLQRTGRPAAWAHHQANVLFNVMRGGVFAHDHDVPVADFRRFLGERNAAVARRHADTVAAWPDTLPVADLRTRAAGTGDADLIRLAHEYLPLIFGRRHGDPSRPWNRFSIRVRDDHGEQALHYEGNWRDIFQNWEALATSFPGFLPSLVAKFVNASTADGFNPYRLTRAGIDWEVPEPEDPWSNIGYWGDHQIVYLLRLLQLLQRTDPGALDAMLGERIFSYADVPYRIRPYADLLRDARDTIVFDRTRHEALLDRAARQGADGKLLQGDDGAVVHATLLEKLLVPALAKLSNLVPGGGIWLNTQRPEWNDANNALAGGGLSVVTLAHLRRYLSFLAEVLAPHRGAALPVSGDVVQWLADVTGALTDERGLLDGPALADTDRRRVLDALGEAFSRYREAVYAAGLSAAQDLPVDRVLELCVVARDWVDHALRASRREDGLLHSYNLLQIQGDHGAAVARLPLMLEGQVAALGSGALSAAESLTLLERLFASDLYDPDRRSFTLMPAHPRPGFLDRNRVDGEAAAAIGLVRDLAAAGDRRLLARDAEGQWRFSGDLASADGVAAVLDTLAAEPRWQEAVARDRDAVLALYEATFAHRSYLGRSQVMYGYEGIGCIYWHMVAKLLLAVQETWQEAERHGADAAVRDGLAAMYFRVRAGLGYEKDVTEYGAFPTDPYSHTPADGGARQPGMTGQVKEEVLTRLGELGVEFTGGTLRLRPRLLQASELLAEPAVFAHVGRDGEERTLDLPAGSLAFTLGQVPVVYVAGDRAPRWEAELADGNTVRGDGDRLDPSVAAEILARSGRVRRLTMEVPRAELREG